MASASRDSEKAGELDGGTLADGSTTGYITDYERDVEKGEDAESVLVAEGAVGEPDSDHDEVEQMDEGHLDDLVRQHVCSPPYLPRLDLL